MNKKLTIGLFGFGVVGEGIYDVLQKTTSLNAVIRKICIKHPDKKRNAHKELFTTDYNDILNDDEINVVVELIDDKDEAYKIVTTALRKRKAVVSANKAMIADHLDELLEIQSQYDVPFLYEAAVCGSIPIIRNLEEYFDNEMLKCISGIVNGSTNYILSKMIDDGLTFNHALSCAQESGFAESNPHLDISGEDAVNKLVILLLHSFGINIDPVKILHKGITCIDQKDIAFANKRNYKIKLVAQAAKLNDRRVAAFLLPQFIEFDNKLYSVHNEFNGVVIESHFADKQFLYGKGAGRYPTASAVLSDIAALRYNYKYEYRKYSALHGNYVSNDFYLRVFVSYTKTSNVIITEFEQIEIFDYDGERKYFVGVIHFERLRNSDWFRQDSVSVIVMPDGIVEKKNKRKNIEKELIEASNLV